MHHVAYSLKHIAYRQQKKNFRIHSFKLKKNDSIKKIV